MIPVFTLEISLRGSSKRCGKIRVHRTGHRNKLQLCRDYYRRPRIQMHAAYIDGTSSGRGIRRGIRLGSGFTVASTLLVSKGVLFPPNSSSWAQAKVGAW
jgi:hypothetical protein